jgi:hypothetical protein
MKVVEVGGGMWEVECGRWNVGGGIRKVEFGKGEDDKGCEPQRGFLNQTRATPWEKQAKEKQPQRGCLTGDRRSC